MAVVWVVPVGLEYDRALAVLERAADGYYIIRSANDGKVSEEARKYAEKVTDYLSVGPFDVRAVIDVDVLDMEACISALQGVLRAELADNDENLTIRINVGTSSKVMAMASLYVACRRPEIFELYYPKTRRYIIMDIVEAATQLVEDRESGSSELNWSQLESAVKEYEALGWTKRPSEGYGLVEIPTIPLQELTSLQKAVLTSLDRVGGRVDSSSALAESIHDRGLSSAAKLSGTRSNVSYAVSALKSWGLLRLRSVGRRKTIELTDSGQLYVKMFLPRDIS